jgi:hypothetical protein
MKGRNIQIRINSISSPLRQYWQHVKFTFETNKLIIVCTYICHATTANLPTVKISTKLLKRLTLPDSA